MKKSLVKKIAGIALGAAVVAGVAGLGGNMTAKANSDSTVSDSVRVEDSDGVTSWSSEEIDSYYDGLRARFDGLSFAEQKAGVIDILEYSITGYTREEGESSDIVDECKRMLAKVKGITTSDELVRLVDADPTLLNFLM